MRNIIFLFGGIFFGILMTKSEAISWFRIVEMFRFESFHMFGIFAVAIVVGVSIIQGMKKFGIKTIDGKDVDLHQLPFNIKRHLLAGLIFGMGWAIVGSCPGPIYVLIGHGFWIFIIVLLGAILGTFLYGLVRDKLPH